MKAYIQVQRQRKNTIGIDELRNQLRGIEGVEQIRDPVTLAGDIVFSATKDRWGNKNPLLKVEGAFNLSRVQQIICSNEYSILRMGIN